MSESMWDFVGGPCSLFHASGWECLTRLTSIPACLMMTGSAVRGSVVFACIGNWCPCGFIVAFLQCRDKDRGCILGSRWDRMGGPKSSREL